MYSSHKLVLTYIHYSECGNPKLLKFRGRPDDYSPKARFNNLVRGIPLPFDRHDWTVDRCGESVRYIIDYYYEEKKQEGVSNPIVVDVRPALDGPGALWDRMRMAYRDLTGQATAASLIAEEIQSKMKKEYDPLEKRADERDLMSEKEFSFLSSLNVPKLATLTGEITNRCRTSFEALQKCKNDNECARASTAMTGIHVYESIC